MKIFLHICWRNIWRNKRRSIVIISSVGVGVFAMLIAMGLLNGIMTQMVDNTINTSLGHISIRNAGPMERMKLHHSFSPYPEIFEALDKNEKPIRGWAPRLKVNGMARSSASSQAVSVIGIDPEKERIVSHLYEYTSKAGGSLFLKDSTSGSILISKDTADRLDLIPGDRMVLMLQDSNRELVGTALIVEGIFQTPVDSFDRFNVFTGIEYLQSLTEAGDKISEINITLSDRAFSGMVRDRLRESLNPTGLQAHAWTDMAPRLVQSINIVDTMMYVSFGIIFITIVFSIANTLIMAIMERFHEIGVMKSIGTPPRLIFFMIMFESITLGILGLAAGAAAGIITTGTLGAIGIDLGIYSETLRAMGSGSTIHPALRLFDIFMASFIVLITASLAAIMPARKAAKTDPIKALTHI